MTVRPSFKEVCATVDLVDLFITVQPGYPLGAAVDLICDLEKIYDVRDRRAIRNLIEAREMLLAPERRAAA